MLAFSVEGLSKNLKIYKKQRPPIFPILAITKLFMYTERPVKYLVLFF